MSIARQLLHEFRPFFRMLDEPLTRQSAALGRSRSLFDDPFGSSFPFTREMLRGSAVAVDVSETPKTYVVEAEIPGVKKENIEVRVGNGGRSLTIEGKLLSGKEGAENASASEGTTESAVQTSAEAATQISAERSVIGSFSRTVFLPRPIDSDSVAAKLQDGILQVTLNKAEDKASVVVNVE